MTKVTCDKCKKEIPQDNKEIRDAMQVHFPLLEITERTGLLWGRKIDLCQECERAVYDFIFGREASCACGTRT